jgi:hypothetical protein
MSNSVADDAFYQGGSGKISTPCVRAVGGIDYSGGMKLSDCKEPWPYSPAADDPFKDVPAPAVAGPCLTVPVSAPGGVAVPVGRYCGGFDLSGNYTLDPGVYVVDGGTFRANAGAQVTGNGVTIYLTNNAKLAWNGNATFDLKAPTAGPYKGVLIFADRKSSDTNDLTFNGTANSALVGAIYAAGRPINMLGDFKGSNGCTQLVASRITLSGNNSYSANCAGAGIGNIQTAGRTRLVE